MKGSSIAYRNRSNVVCESVGYTENDISLFYSDHNRDILMELEAYPTRVDDTAILFTWNSEFVNDFVELKDVRRYLTTIKPENLELKEHALSYDNPFSNLPEEYIYSNDDITDYATDGGLYRDWVGPGYYVLIVVRYYTESDHSYGYISWIYLNNATSSNVISSAPSLTYNSNNGKFTIGTSMVGKRIIEFYNSDKPYGYPTSISDVETLQEMYYVSLLNMERYNPFQCYYYLNSDTKLCRWPPGTYHIGVTFRSNTNKQKISNAINNAIRLINSILNTYLIFFYRTDSSNSDISIIVDSEYNLYGIDPETSDYVYGGTWETFTNDNCEITEATIKLANDYYEYVPYSTYETVALEEIIQSMGAGYDQIVYPFNTLHTDFNYLNKPSDYISYKDKDIFKLLYSNNVLPADDYTKVALSLNIPQGCYMVSNTTVDSTRTVSDSFLKKNNNYKVRAFIVNLNGKVSYTSNWIDVYVEDRRPENFSWTYSKIFGKNFILTADEWNSFTSRINEFRVYKGLSEYSYFIKVEPGDSFTATMYNHARTAIRAISGYGTLIPEVERYETITAHMMNILVSELNAIP